MKIFLIGFMGCGKSTLAKKLATKLSYDLIDLDQELEQVAGCTIAAYFAAHGEDAFRNLEAQTLKTMDYPENCVVATGGGTPCFGDNINWMNENGATVYIQMNPFSLAKRLESGIAKRPLLHSLSEAELVQFITTKLEERNPYYLQAEYVMNGINLTADLVKSTLFPGEEQILEAEG